MSEKEEKQEEEKYIPFHDGVMGFVRTSLYASVATAELLTKHRISTKGVKVPEKAQELMTQLAAAQQEINSLFHEAKDVLSSQIKEEKED